ncbi:MAG TPA: MFS transporter [Longimicrobiales bacterium]
MFATSAGVARTLSALRHRNFRLFFLGQGVSRIGTWMQQVAMNWLVYRLTGSPAALGLVAFAGYFPAFVLGPFAGVLADRRSRYRVVLATQMSAATLAAALAALVLTGVVEVWHVVVLAALVGVVNGFDVPARQALLVELVGGTGDLPNAIALNSSMFNAARLVGPAIAGILIGLVGEGLVFLIDAASYLAVIGGLLAIHVPATPRPRDRPPVLRTLRDGFGYAYGFPPIRAILALLALVSLLGMPYAVLLPVFASDVLGGGAHTLGFLTAAAGLGALTAAVWLASRTTVRGLGRVIVAAATLFGFGLVVFSRSRVEWLSLVLLVIAGFGVMATTASINTVLQTIVEEDKRGRVMSFYTMAFMGMTPFGGLLAGILADWIGAPNTVLLGGLAVMLAAAWFARRLPVLRAHILPIYERLGIVSEVATGIQTATELRPRS